nr:hypothetical protein [Tanacetum cinerariifolium]
MMQRLLPYGIQQYLPDKIAKPIIELRSLFKQICSATLIEDDMLKAQIKVVDILCDLEFIYHPALFDIMIHLVIYLPLEDLKGGPIRPQWMFPFERYIKKLKVDGVRYVMNNRDKCRTTQNNGICSPGPNGEMYYGQLQEILEFKYLLFKVVLFRVKWFDTRNQGRKVKCLVLRNNMTQINCRDGQSTKVDAPPDIIDVHDEDDDIIDDEDALPHDLADFDDEDLISVDDDGVDKVYSSEEED